MTNATEPAANPGKEHGNGERYSLKFGSEGVYKTGIPLLGPFYSYLLVLGKGVGIVDLYPWLAELMFHSVAVPSNRPEVRSPQDGARPINLIGFFIDDHQNSLAATVSKTFLFDKDDPFLEFKKQLVVDSGNPGAIPRHFIVDTFGEFGDPRNGWDWLSKAQEGANGERGNQQAALEELNKHCYRPLRVVGSGNPMQLMRRFTEIGEVEPEFFGDDQERQLGVLNCFLLNSISNLYRTMGFRDAMQFVRVLLKTGVWKPPPDPEGISGKIEKRKLIDRDGMLFATLHDGVFSDEEIRYAETFFDGVIRFFVDWEEGDDSAGRRIGYVIERLPPPWVDSEAESKPGPRRPRFPKPYSYPFEFGQRMRAGPLNDFERRGKVPSGIVKPSPTGEGTQ